MTHLKEEQLIDLAEGTRPESAEPHLASCDRCRAELAELRAVLSVATEVEVPEPSPLFWDHFSARVRDAVANQAADASESAGSVRRGWASRTWGWRLLVPAAALAALVLAAAIAVRSPLESGSGDVSTAGASATAEVAPGRDVVDEVDVAARVDDDPSLSLLADLASELDWDDAVQAGLMTGSASLDRVVFDMSADERQELRRILNDELENRKKLEVKS